MKIALVHDYLFEYGGAERVLEALHEIYPKAPIYTSFIDWDWVRNNKQKWLEWNIIPSWYDKIPFKKSLCSPLRFLAPWIWESFDLKNFDLVISSSAWFMCKGVITHPSTTHICYCHTPPRYLYGYPESAGRRNFLAKVYGFFINPFLRCYDYLSSCRVDYFIANSNNVALRIKKFYKREAVVIYPPTKDIKSKTGKLKSEGENYFLMVNRLVWPKRIDLAIKVCQKLDLKLKIVGQGKAEKELKELAKNSQNIQFLGYVQDSNLQSLYAKCQAVLCLAQDEDFGIVPTEAMSWGKPVIALRSGGLQETVIDKKTGFFISQPDPEELEKILTAVVNKKLTVNAQDCYQQAKKFSLARFKQEIKEFVEKKKKS